ncbi:DUF3298 and DUF4163 domain-containing protein [Thermaerobacillus caldiproteolyticus]|uniref:DUF3298 and DUF4163 domain-containing protein n=1 Tax=Thermaerobacillus caldiproteolyticus TaxID=247480 RepID=UPI00188A5F58|nr:DUF3298 and DUF4163 domain-containing protein [Anoxybacillus caldiproteolyticus]QPA32539.1 DUF3298 and DUF4163 domain-containing protein [Anoxybacillus caldiproteolyticus]
MVTLPVNIHTEYVKQKRLELYYPVIYGLPNKEAEKKINYEILASVQQILMDQGFYENPLTEITGHFELKTNEKDVLSLTIINYAYSGGAHGLTLMKGVTFDVSTGKKYLLSELFLDDSDYVKVLSSMVSTQIKERDIFLLNPPFKSVSPEQDFYIADKALVLFYQLYKLTAYAFGFPYFPISVYAIEKVVDPQSPLGKMLP